MIIVKEINKLELPEVVRFSYEGDTDLFEKYHVDKYTHQQATDSTIQMIHNMNMAYPLTCYQLLADEKEIGYMVTGNELLYSFAVNKNFRTKEVLKEVWEKICEILGHQFKCWLYPNNTRAIKWLEKCGMVITEEKEIVTLIYLKKTIRCPLQYR